MSPLWSIETRAEFAVGAMVGTLISFGCGCLIALIAGGSLIPAFSVVAVVVALGAFVTGLNLLIGLLMMAVLPASIGIGALLIEKRRSVLRQPE